MNHRLRPLWLAVLLTAAMALPAHAWAQGSMARTELGEREAPRQLKGVVTFGFTGGGDELDNFKFVDGSTRTVKAGEQYYLGVGLAWALPSSPIVVQGTVNYHLGYVDGTIINSTYNGSLNFRRYPLELEGVYNFGKWRFGLGGRYVIRPELTLDDPDPTAVKSVRFKRAIGLVTEAGYSFSPHFSLNLRYVVEKYTARDTNNFNIQVGDKFRGNHYGINFIALI